MKKGCLLIIVLLFFLTISCNAMEPQNERTDSFEANITTNVVPQSNGMVEYHYIINYSSANKRELFSLRFLFHKKILEAEFVKTSGKAPRSIEWIGNLLESGKFKDFSFRPFGNTRQQVVNLDSNRRLYTNPKFLKPGETLEITLVTRNETTIPGIVDLEGMCTQAVWVFEDAGDAPRNFDTGVHPKLFRVVGPCEKPDSVQDKIDKLKEFTRNAYITGLITKYDVLTGLMDKLTAAGEKISSGKGNYHTAANILNAYKNLLEAQHEKAITDECYQMLLVNVNELIAALG